MKSLYETTLDLYRNLDDTTDNHFKAHKRQAPCAKGCASCCSQFFEISALEFALMYEFVDRLPTQAKEALKKRSETLFSLFQEHWPILYKDYFTPSTIHLHTNEYYQHAERYKVVLPCVFLSDEGACEIYDRRPIVCRTTGVGFQYLFNTGAVCNVIHHGLLTPFWQADLRPFKSAIEEVRWLPDQSDMGVKRQYPMFYYVHDLFGNEQSAHWDNLLKAFKSPSKD